MGLVLRRVCYLMGNGRLRVSKFSRQAFFYRQHRHAPSDGLRSLVWNRFAVSIACYTIKARSGIMKEGSLMSEQEPSLPAGTDIPSAWGFHILQELRRMEDKSDAKIDGLSEKISSVETKMESKIDALDTQIVTVRRELDNKIDTMRRELDSKIDTTRRELDSKIDGLRYWSWATTVVVIIAAITTIRTLHR